MSSLPKSERGYFANTRKLCNGNLNGFLYALVGLSEEPKYGNPVLSYSADENYHLNEQIEYIGITNNPIARLQAHRIKSKGQYGKSKGRKKGRSKRVKSKRVKSKGRKGRKSKSKRK